MEKKQGKFTLDKSYSEIQIKVVVSSPRVYIVMSLFMITTSDNAKLYLYI